MLGRVLDKYGFAFTNEVKLKIFADSGSYDLNRPFPGQRIRS